MQRQRLDSSSLASVGYDPAARLLEVEFRNGGVYQYLGVPRGEYREFMDADSKGRFINAEIKPHYEMRKLSDPRH